jgi:hypothetical protein
LEKIEVSEVLTMKKLVVFLLVISSSVFAYEIETIDLGGGRSINYAVSTDYKELENLLFTNDHVRINIGQTSNWDDNTQNENLSPKLRNMLRQYTQRGKYQAFAMAVFYDNDIIVEVIVNWCYRDKDTGDYKQMTSYWQF